MKQNILCIPLLLILLSCSEQPSLHFKPTTGFNETGQPALHAIQNQQLRNLMDRMNSLMQERFLTEPELDAERLKYARQILNTTQALSQTIDSITMTLPKLELSAAEQTTFLALATKLHEQTQTLQQQAEQNRLEAIANTLEQMNTTCTSCHALFRQL